MPSLDQSAAGSCRRRIAWNAWRNSAWWSWAVAPLEQVAGETGQSLDTLIADTLAARFAPSAPGTSADAAPVGERIRLRPARLAGWPTDAAFRREEIYGDDAR